MLMGYLPQRMRGTRGQNDTPPMLKRHSDELDHIDQQGWESVQHAG